MMNENDKVYSTHPLVPPSNPNPEAPFVVQDVDADSEIKFVASPEAQAAADKALGDIRDRSFSGRNPELGKMINCQVCDRRHRAVIKCKQVFKQLWVDEDVETGELTIQYATVPLPGQNPGPKAIIGAAFFAKKRKNPHPSRRKLQYIRLVRKLTPDEYTQEDLKDAREMAAELLGLNKTRAEKYAHMASKEYRAAQKAKLEAAKAAEVKE